MKSTFLFTIRTPESEIASREVESVYITTETGDMMLMPHYGAFAGVVSYSPVVLKDGGHEENYLAYRGLLFFSNTRNQAELLCQRCDLKGKVDYTGLADYLKRIETLMESGKDLSEYHIRFLEGEKIALVQEMEGRTER